MARMYHSLALVFLQRWEEAEEIARGSVAATGDRNPWTWVFLMIGLGSQGKSENAAAVIPELMKVTPHWDRDFVENFLDERQEDKELLPPIFEIPGGVWPEENTDNVINFRKKLGVEYTRSSGRRYFHAATRSRRVFRTLITKRCS